MMCAIHAGKRGRKTALLDHSETLGAKILISGGGRCNFTNLTAAPENYLSNNPHFPKSALSRFTPADFIQMIKEHRIPYHEKKLGQLFCDRSARDIVGMLEEECRKVNAEFFLKTTVLKVYLQSPSSLLSGVALAKSDAGESRGEGDFDSSTPPLTLPSPPRGEGKDKKTQKENFVLKTNNDDFSCDSLVIATGGLSIPKVGATDFGYKIAKQFDLNIVETAPALDGFRLKQQFNDLTGVSADVIVTCGKASFRENILFTHAGLSGPAALQASLYWRPGNSLKINFVPKTSKGELAQWFKDYKKRGSKSELRTLLKEWLPSRLADRFCELELKPPHISMAAISNEKIEEFCEKIQSYSLTPLETVGYNKAEVTRGGVDTDELSSKTMESKKVPGLYFIGEVVDVTGWLGGYNFQWAWSSGYAAGEAV